MKVENIIGLSPYSDILSVHYAEKPDAPLVPKYVARSGGDLTIDLSPFITIEWEAPFETNGAPILGFLVQMSINSGDFAVALDASSNPNQKTFKFQGLIAGQSYRFRVAARNVKGWSPYGPSITILAATMPPKMKPLTIGTITPNED